MEHDDFLREILGNILHKKGNYIISTFRIEEAIKEAGSHDISLVILGTSCPFFKGKETLQYLRKNLSGEPEFFIINEADGNLDFLPTHKQINIQELSLKKIFKQVAEI